MEYITRDLTMQEMIIGMILYVVLFWLLLSIVSKIKKAKAINKEMKKDTNIEWYGPEIYLKEKIYEQDNGNADCNSDRKADRFDDGRFNDNSNKIESKRISN